MRLLFVLLFVSLLAGQLGGLTLKPGIVVYPHDLVSVLLILGIWWRARQNGVTKPRLMVPLCLFAAAVVLSLVANISRYSWPQIVEASLYFLRWMLYAGVYVAAVQEKVLAAFLKRGLFIVGSAISLLGLMQLVLYPNLRNLWYLGWDPHYYRLFSTFLDPNFAGLFIILAILVGLVDRRLFPSRLLWATQVLNICALYFTYSRSSYLAFAGSVVAWIVMKKEWRLLLGILLFGVVLLLPTPGGDTLKLTRMDSSVARVENWQASLMRFSEAPVFGHGFNTLRFRPIFSAAPLSPGVVSRSAGGVDSSILFLLITTGIAGVSAYAWLLYAMCRLSRSIGVMLAAILIHSLFVNSLVYPWILLFMWVYAGASERASISGT